MKTNNGIFTLLYNTEFSKEWADFFDWIFVEDKFLGWDKEKKECFTKRIKSIDCFKKEKYYTKTDKIPKRANGFIICISVKGSQAESLVKHIRNGFAHGNVRRRYINNSFFIELRDYYQKKPTAYILVPERFLVQIKKEYDSLCKG